MKNATRGMAWAFLFVILEASQAVFFGGVFQAFDSFVIGAAVFGLSALGALFWTGLRTPDQIRIAWKNKHSLLALNLSTAVVWVSYFFALQMIEPAVVFTVFSGLIPIVVLIAAQFGVPEASNSRNSIEGAGLLIVGIGVGYLCSITLLGQSGFVRGGLLVASVGLALSFVSAASLAIMMIYSQRLDHQGVAPAAQYGLRFPIYVVVALLAVWLGLDAKASADSQALIVVIIVGFAIMAFPVFAMQKAISLIDTLTLAAITALGPLFVFLFQLIEARVSYSAATTTGLVIYFSGALLAAYGGTKKNRHERQLSKHD